MAQRTYFEKIVKAKEDRIDLAESALQIAADEYPDLDIPFYLKLLAGWTRKLKKEVSQLPPRMALERLNDWLFDTMNFSGNEENYYDPRNSFLNNVIDSRKGIPISLSVIYLELAWGMGLDASGVGFPGHFLVRVMDEGRPLYVDAFHKGRILTADGCSRFLAEITEGEMEFQETYLESVSKRGIIARMLRNLKRIYLEQNNFAKLIRILDKLVILEPNSTEEIRDRGIIHYQMKAFRLAQQDFETFLSLAPDSEDFDVINQYLEILREYRAHLN